MVQAFVGTCCCSVLSSAPSAFNFPLAELVSVSKLLTQKAIHRLIVKRPNTDTQSLDDDVVRDDLTFESELDGVRGYFDAFCICLN